MWGPFMPENCCKTLLADETGATAIEYGVLAMLIGVGLAGIMLSLGDEVETTYNTVSSEYTSANTAANAGA